MTVLLLAETVVLALLAFLVAGLLRAYGDVLRRVHRLEDEHDRSAPSSFTLPPVRARESAPSTAGQGSAAADVEGATLAGELVTVRVAEVEHDTLLLFLSSGCPSCATFWDELAGPFALPVRTRLLVVVQGPGEDSSADLARIAPDGIDVVASTAAWRDYEVPGSPHVVFVDGRTGRVRGEGTGQSLAQVIAMVDRAAPSPADPSRPGVGVRPGSGQTAQLGHVPPLAKSPRDAAQEIAADRELLAAGFLPGDPRLWQAAGPAPSDA